jgi:hypothetical protein
MADAWNVAQLRDVVLLHLEERSPRYLGRIYVVSWPRDRWRA